MTNPYQPPRENRERSPKDDRFEATVGNWMAMAAVAGIGALILFLAFLYWMPIEAP